MSGERIVKYLKIDRYKLYATAIIAFAMGLRVLLVALHWPPTNSDEGTMALMADFIAYKGEHPLVFWGQDYMGLIEAYLGAFFFHLSGGPSITALRMGVILIVCLFFISTYNLAALLFTKKQALATIALLSVGSIPYLTRQTIATGGAVETLLFCSLAFLLGTWLSLTYDRYATRRTKLLRLSGYLAFGLVGGLAFYSDSANVLMFLGMATLLLLICCWREIFIWGGWLIGLLGAAIGLSPWLLYCDIYFHFKINPFSIMYGLAHGTDYSTPITAQYIWHNILNTVQVTLPTATGFPFCPVIEYPFLGDNTPRTLQCSVLQSTWSIGYLLLLISAIALSTILLVRVIRNKNKTTIGPHEYQQLIVRQLAPLLMVIAASLEIGTFPFTSGPVSQPGYHARYFIGLLTITPALIAPLWMAASRIKLENVWQRLKAYAGRAMFVAITAILITGTCIAFSEVPRAQAQEAQRTDLINQLESMGITRLYTEYWTCYSLIFASREQIECGVITPDLRPSHNRYAPPDQEDSPFRQIVDRSTHQSWMCPINPDWTMPEWNCLPTLRQWVKGKNFKEYDVDGYAIFQPLSHPAVATGNKTATPGSTQPTTSKP